MKLDFHVHTKYSVDSRAEPKDIISVCRKKGITPVIADHNNMLAHPVFKKLRFPFIPAEEISTDKGDLIGLFIEEPIKKKTQFLEALDLIEEQGGISYLPHMYDRARGGVGDGKPASRVEIIEVFNSHCIFGDFNQRAMRFAEKNKKLKAAGSDAHFAFEVGNAYVEMQDFDIGDPKALLKSLKNGRITGKKAPLHARGLGVFVKLSKKILR